MNNANVLKKLKKLNACTEAVDWVERHGGDADALWNDCERSDWMWWLLRKTKTPAKAQSVKYAKWCADRAKKYAADAAAADAAAAYADADAYADAYAATAVAAADAAAAYADAYAATAVAAADADAYADAYAATAVAAAAADADAYAAADVAVYIDERAKQADYIRKNFHNPFRGER